MELDASLSWLALALTPGLACRLNWRRCAIFAGCRLINWTEPQYPQTLLQIYDPPVLFYLRGDPQILNLPCLSIVGTRRPTLYGSQMAERLGRDLGRTGPGDSQRPGAEH